MDHDALSQFSPRLTGREYEKSVIDLYRQASLPSSSTPSKDLEEELKFKEFCLTIDYRLGVNFPTERRDALWNARQKVEKQRLRLVGKFIMHTVRKRAFAGGMQLVLEQMKEEFAKVLSDDELQAFMELDENETPISPIDPSQL